MSVFSNENSIFGKKKETQKDLPHICVKAQYVSLCFPTHPRKVLCVEAPLNLGDVVTFGKTVRCWIKSKKKLPLLMQHTFKADIAEAN